VEQIASQFDSLSRTERAARLYAERWRQNLLAGLWAIMTGNKAIYREFKSEWKSLCSEPTEEEIQRTIAAIPEYMRWWEVTGRQPTEREAKLECQQCGQPFGARQVKVCPSCKVVLHAVCFDDPHIDGYSTPDCECCRCRCEMH
jgi:hypothetical protein